MTLPIAFVTTRHRCPHCRKSYAHAKTAAQHMTRCFTNPDARSCKTCTHRDVDGEFGSGCSVGALDGGPTCSRCGAFVSPAEGLCPDLHYDKVLYGLRVHCDQWAEVLTPTPNQGN